MKRFNGWEEVNTQIGKGIAPLIVSASRSTDIPAFYTEWFINRFRKGYLKWVNPFNRKTQIISLEKTRVYIFWSKNPEPLIIHLPELDEQDVNYYFQFTLNDYEFENLEPQVPKLSYRMEVFKKLSRKIGKEKVIWRFDPLILTNKTDANTLLKKIEYIGNEIYKHTDKLVISFADISIYKNVKRNMDKHKLERGIEYKEFEENDIKEIASGLQKLNKKWNIEIATCAEQIDLYDDFNIKHNRCIDDDLMKKLFGNDKILMDFLGVNQNTTNNQIKHPLKDKGQRKLCGCIYSKDIGQYNTCKHLCVYCYANYNKNRVIANIQKHSKEAETIIPY